MVILTIKDICFIENACLKAGNAKLLEKIAEIKDYIHFHNLDGITLDMDWRKDREEETETKSEIEDELNVDMITLSKALKNGIWSKGGFYDACYLDAKPEFVSPDELEIGRDFYEQYDNDDTFQNCIKEENALCFYTHNYEEKVYSVRMKDYGKTWALTKEELL